MATAYKEKATDSNIFRQAKDILQRKEPSEFSQDEYHTVNAAMIPLLQLRMFNDLPILDGLEALARMVDDANPE